MCGPVQYTAFARDVARGVSRRWVRNLYRFAIHPNLAFYFRVPLDVALGRILGGATPSSIMKPAWTWAGARRGRELPHLPGRILDEYEAMSQEMGFHVIDATMSIEEQQRQMRDIVMNEMATI